jgi:DNA replication initiation complex subunit (GINS family)
MELNELTKGKEKDLSNDLESIINDIDSFVFEQVVTNDVKDNVREMLDNINGGNDWENAMQYTEPIKPSKSKKSKSMPNIDINNIMNNPNLPDDIRNMLTRGLESGMDTING